MRKPKESLDEYIVTPAPKVTSEPPRSVWLRRTGEVEVLKPLTRSEVLRKRAWPFFKPRQSHQPLWFRRFLVAGSGALVFVAMVLVSAILVSIGDPASGPEVATGGTADDTSVRHEELYSFDLSIPLTLLPETGVMNMVRSSARRRPMRPGVHLVITKPKRQLRPLPQPEQPRFVPTTLVIYAENGVINTRIEPWLQYGDKRPSAFNN